jgi:glutamyl-tRNA reductase
LIKIYPFIKHFDYDDRYNLIKDADILITSTTSPHTIIHKKDIQKSYKQVIMLDLSMPRDIENDVKNLKNVELYDIDSISKISEENIQRRQKLGVEAINIIEDDISEFCKWADNMSVDKAIKKLNEQCDIIYKDTMSYINRKVELNHREQKIVEKMLLSALKRMIKAPIQVLKQTDEKQRQNEYIKILEELFDIS